MNNEALEIAKQGIDQYKPALEELATTNKPFYRFFVVDYFATGEGRSIWLKICRNYPSYDGKDREKEKWEKFVGHEYYLQCSEEQTEEEFFKRYGNLIPERIKIMVEKRDQPIFTWETHYHFNYS
jgi:hypothetical protein